MDEELQDNRKKLAQAEKKELGLLKQQRELQEAKQSVELEVQRKLAKESKKLQQDALEKAAQAQELKLQAKEDLIESLKKQIAEMHRRAEVGSQEAQGEALEGKLHDVLTAAFPFDSFEEIKKGARGADILQTVRNAGGRSCGHILWEAKNTQHFQKSWVGKLKKDQQAAQADVAVLMSMALPKGVKDFAYSEDNAIWITGYASAIGLCMALRQTLVQVAREKGLVENRDTFKDVVYNYVTGHDFARRVRAIAGAYTQMQHDLEAEKRAMSRIWKKREKQIAVVLDNVAEMHGEIEALAGPGKALPGVETLMLESITPEDIDELLDE